MLHPVLQRQLRKHGLNPEAAPDLDAWARFLERVNRSYLENDQDRYTLERSLAVSSEEMRDLARQLQSALGQVQQLSLTDELTGLRNRRFLNASIPEDVALAIRHYRNIQQGRERRTPLNIDIVFLMVDLDHFKVVNDTYGHLAGDRVLIQMSRILTACCRDTDTVIRWGGEEFLVVARSACRSEHIILAERIRQSVEADSFEIGKGQAIRITCSIGATVFPFLPEWPDVVSWDRVVELADLCLYAAKRSGRNAWVGLLPTGLASLEDLTLHLDEHIPDLVRGGKLELSTSLPDTAQVLWHD